MGKVELDFYQTPQKLTQVLLENQSAIQGKILEPCCGSGAISSYLLEQGFGVQATDIKDGEKYDATTFNYWETIPQPVHWIVTNPPFTDAPIILKYSLEHAKVGVAMLLRLSFLEPCKNRSELLQTYADNFIQIIPFNPRVKFNPDDKGTDNVTVAWFVWNKNFSWQKIGIRCPFKFENNWK